MKKYNSYKDSGVEWIGEIPSHWEIRRLKYVSDIYGRIGFRGYTNADLVSEDEGAITLSPTNIVDGIMNYDKCSYLSWEKYYESPEIMVNNGDVIFVKTASVGKNALVENLPKEATLNPQFVVFKNIKCNNKFLYWILQTPIASYQVDNSKVGSTIPTISQEKIGNYLLIMPPRKEQDMIVSYINLQTSRIDRIIKAREKKIKLLEELRNAIISKAVTKGIDSNVETKDSGIEWIGKIPKHWEIGKVKFVCKINGRIGFRGYTKEDLVQEGEGAYTIGGKHITNCVLDLSDPEFISWDKYYESPEIMVKKGDILTAQRGSLGKTALVREEIGEATINPSLVLINNIKINRIFLYYYLVSNSFLTYIDVLNTSTAVPMISQTQLSNINIPLPEIEEQNEIAEFLDTETKHIDETISKTEYEIELLKEYRSSLITEVVTGKRKVVV